MLRSCVLAGVLSGLLLCASTGALADDPAASDASIRQLFELTQPQRLLKVMSTRLDESFDAGVKAALGDRQPPPELQAILDEQKAKLIALLREYLDWSRFEPMMIEVYSDTFSQREVDAMVAFYRTPEGRSMLEKLPLVTQKSMQLAQARMRDLTPRVAEIQRETLARLKALEDGAKAPQN